MACKGDLLQILIKLNHPKSKCIDEISKKHFQSKNTKFNSEALGAFSNVITVFIAEAAARSAIEAKKDVLDETNKVEIKNEHLEKILPQLLLQF